MGTKQGKRLAGRLLALSMAAAIAFGSIGMQVRAEEDGDHSEDKITGLVTYDPTVTYYGMDGNTVTSINAGEEVYVEFCEQITGIPSGVRYSYNRGINYSLDAGRKELTWLGNDSASLPSWYTGIPGALFKLWVSSDMQATQINMFVQLSIPPEGFAEGWTPQPGQEGAFRDYDGGAFTIEKVVGPLTVNAGTGGTDEPIGPITNNSKVFYYDAQGNEITSANPGDIVYAATTWDIAGGARGLQISSAFGCMTSSKEAVLEFVSTPHPAWVPDGIGDLWKITISKNISTPKLECAVHARLAEKYIDATWPPQGQRGWWTENNFGREFWIDNAERFYLTINGVTGNNSSAEKQAVIRDIAPSKPPEEEIISNKVQTADGTVLESTVGGVYAASSINGAAVRTEYTAVASAAGISTEQIAAGTNARFYFCDGYNKAAREALRGAAETSGGQVAAYLNADLYTISKEGVVTSVRQTSSPVNMVFGIPNKFIGKDHTFSIIIIKPDGETVVLKDLDDDPNTITVETQFFGAYVIVY